MRHVFSNHEIPHKWAHQTQEHARGSNLFFDGPTIYSYGRHFPIATVYDNKRGKLVLFTSADYSMTTAKHKVYVLRAIPREWRTIVCPHVGPNQHHPDNLAYFERVIAKAAERAKRRTRECYVQADASDAADAHKSMADYMIFFGIQRKMPPLPSFDDAFERARRIENPDPAEAARRAKSREKRDALAQAVAEYREEMARSMREAGHGYLGYRVTSGNRWPAMLARMTGQKAEPGFYRMARRTDWRLFGAFGSGAHYGQGGCMLRVNGEELETSQGARVPLAAAPMVWNLWQRAVAEGGRDFSKGLGARIQIGDYPLDSIDAHGTIKAGCHIIPASEVQAMARQLRLT